MSKMRHPKLSNLLNCQTNRDIRVLSDRVISFLEQAYSRDSERQTLDSLPLLTSSPEISLDRTRAASRSSFRVLSRQTT